MLSEKEFADIKYYVEHDSGLNKNDLQNMVETIEAQQQEIENIKSLSLIKFMSLKNENEQIKTQYAELLEDITHLHTIVIPEYEGVLKLARASLAIINELEENMIKNCADYPKCDECLLRDDCNGYSIVVLSSQSIKDINKAIGGGQV